MTACSAGEIVIVEPDDRGRLERLRLMGGRSPVAGGGWGGLEAAGRLVPLPESSAGCWKGKIIEQEK